MKSLYKKLSHTLLLLSSLLHCSISMAGEQLDDYRIYIKNESRKPLFYSFKKATLTGNVLGSTGTLYQPLSYVDELKEVNIADYPALARDKTLTKRVTQNTMLFVSENSTALENVVKGSATRDQKKLVFSKKVPQQLGTYCTNDLTFIISSKGEKLIITPVDNRKCMRSGSKQAELTRKIQRQARAEFGKTETLPPLYEESLKHPDLAPPPPYME